MNLATACFEIVHFAFRDDLALAEQVTSRQQLGQWTARQPGFRARQCYHDPKANRWTDVVERESAAQALAAMARSQQDASLSETMALIEPETLHVGHFTRLT